MEMLVKMTAVLVKIAVMMIAPGGVLAPPEARGREPPFFFFFFLDRLPRWEKGFPSGPWLPWLGRGESPSEIGSISLFLRSLLALFHRFVYIWRSVTPTGPETFAVIFFRILAFLRQKKSVNRLTVGSRG